MINYKKMDLLDSWPLPIVTKNAFFATWAFRFYKKLDPEEAAKYFVIE